MPIYEYTCQDCGQGFECLLLNSREEKDLTCPHCQSGRVSRRMSGFALGGGGGSAGISTGGSCGSSGGFS